MLQNDVLDDALDYIKTTPPFTLCHVKEVTEEEGAADVRLGFPSDDIVEVDKLLENCYKFARSQTWDEYTLNVPRSHNVDVHGDFYFEVRVIAF